jgi:outer membrane protein W
MSPRSLLAAVLFLLTAAGAAAGEHPQRLSVFTVNPSTDGTGGAGLSYSYGFTPRWSAEFSAAVQRHINYLQLTYRLPPPPGTPPVYFKRSVTTYGYSALLVYRRENASRFTPWIGAGIHHVPAPQFTGALVVVPSIPGPPASEDEVSRTSAKVAVGLELRLTERLGVRAGVERLLRNDGVNYDRVAKGVLALDWRLR